ncbi:MULTISPECIES: single-stranded-DNA-specific exonuclease RecJ [Planktothrix]|uniref:single-stranded-DNA-specific exonuclease RecJ n=1 Tax=Planktothrix TaxID=54304 RepID=UPI0004090DF3|nr:MULTISPECIES: DHH family phosphoesterase [Planktothrix]CAD0225407.1 Single-stranded-DNA-specific exonuclease [Planktothrix agardhii]CAD5918154.1 Single-stranded-DNA-specific exonuclease RecJ [Planktothrix agardhii]
MQPSSPESLNCDHLPNQRWYIFPQQSELAQQLADTLGIIPLVTQVLINRGIETPEQAEAFLTPESQVLPSPLEEFKDLEKSVELLENAINQGDKIAICGDYDADGMTSTALLMRSLSTLGANVNYAIPSRMKEGYGINTRIVEEFHQEDVKIILTVDNGISAYQPIARAKELGLIVIITDHHDLPEKLPPADAILNPKLLPLLSPYRGLAGVGVAYVLAICLSQKLGKIQGLVNPLLELFTLGTIADLAPLVGVNRRWLKRGLKLIPYSQITGIQALIQVAGVSTGYQVKSEEQPENSLPSTNNKTLKPDDIGFRLGPRINAIGRLADPQIVIELLTTENMGIALERAMQCEQINQQRQLLCEEIQQEAIAWVEEQQIDFQQERVLVVVQPEWHHGVIGIVASRLVERYGVPVFIGTYEQSEDETESPKIVRGSARGIAEFDIFKALEYCQDLLGKFGGHKAAGGFSFPAENLDKIRTRLSEFAHQCLELEHLKPLIKIDAQASLSEINFNLYDQINQLHPCGIENNAPTFWTPNVRIVQQKVVGKGHIKLTLTQDKFSHTQLTALPTISAMAWRWGEYFPLPHCLDIAYQLKENNWNGQTNIELELAGARLPESPEIPHHQVNKSAEFDYNDKQYSCSLSYVGNTQELKIRNQKGEVLAIKKGQRFGLLGKSRQDAQTVDVSQPVFYNLIQAAVRALEDNQKE